MEPTTIKPPTIDQVPAGTPVWISLVNGSLWTAGTVTIRHGAIGMVQVDPIEGRGTYFVPLSRIMLRTQEAE